MELPLTPSHGVYAPPACCLSRRGHPLSLVSGPSISLRMSMNLSFVLSPTLFKGRQRRRLTWPLADQALLISSSGHSCDLNAELTIHNPPPDLVIQDIPYEYTSLTLLCYTLMQRINGLIIKENIKACTNVMDIWVMGCNCLLKFCFTISESSENIIQSPVTQMVINIKHYATFVHFC